MAVYTGGLLTAAIYNSAVMSAASSALTAGTSLTAFKASAIYIGASAVGGGVSGAIVGGYVGYRQTGSLNGALNGALKGAVAGGVAGAGTAWASGLGTATGRITAKGVVSAGHSRLQDGDVRQGFIAGIATASASELYKSSVGKAASSDTSDGTGVPKPNGTDSWVANGSNHNDMGLSVQPGEKIGWFRRLGSELGPLRYVTEYVPGQNAWAALHDQWGGWLDKNGYWNAVTNLGSMPAAAGVTFAALGDGMSGLHARSTRDALNY